MLPAALYTIIIGEALITMLVVACRIERVRDRRAFVMRVNALERDVRIT